MEKVISRDRSASPLPACAAPPVKGVVVTDHALLRYFERVLGIDLDKCRSSLAERAAPAAAMGADRFTHDGVTFRLAPNRYGPGIVIATVMSATTSLKPPPMKIRSERERKREWQAMQRRHVRGKP